MIALLSLIFLSFANGATNFTSANAIKGWFGYACSTITFNGNSSVGTPSTECGYNYVCAVNSLITDVTTPVCSSLNSNVVVQRTAGVPCNTLSDCDQSFYCANLTDPDTRTWLNTQYQNSKQTQFTGTIYPGYIGVCICTPPMKTTPPTYSGINNYITSQGMACSTPTDCKYQVLTGNNTVGGNQVGGYWCNTYTYANSTWSQASQCYAQASCNIASHQCEQPSLAAINAGFVYYNSACNYNNCTANTYGNSNHPVCSNSNLYPPSC